MTHDEFIVMYDDALRHSWVTSKDPNKAAQQKKREKEYNRDYYHKHSKKWRDKYVYESDYDQNNPRYRVSRMDEDKLLSGAGLHVLSDADSNGYYKRTDITAKELREYLNGSRNIENIRNDQGDILTKKQVRDLYDSLMERANEYNNPSRLASIAKDKASKRARDLRQGIKSREDYINAIGGTAKLETKLDEISVAIKRKAKQFIKKLLG